VIGQSQYLALHSYHGLVYTAPFRLKPVVWSAAVFAALDSSGSTQPAKAHTVTVTPLESKVRRHNGMTDSTVVET
jgi:hypothetical protein